MESLVTASRCNDIGGHVIHKPQQASAAYKHFQYSDGNYVFGVFFFERHQDLASIEFVFSLQLSLCLHPRYSSLPKGNISNRALLQLNVPDCATNLKLIFSQAIQKGTATDT